MYDTTDQLKDKTGLRFQYVTYIATLSLCNYTFHISFFNPLYIVRSMYVRVSFGGGDDNFGKSAFAM